ncbi:AraC family transcriptional regulator [Yoonia sp. F2084L]|uniref:helix-turn-helix transcriptional regulator n=1 Tax=Yoonia sp. F2084L TaxID=2926419 RepID=UPI001FF4DF1B|nr:AraC family transcriptional regulator [Yoonia sp. F2084L]MCK0096988.1 AraC family transcriptional regulator [Yoonia sp. F2084L]
MTNAKPAINLTVSGQFIADWLAALRPLCTEAQFQSLLKRSDLATDQRHAHGRVTLDQIVGLYQLAAVETGDEMMGLWSRPIRPRALQHLLTSVREATSLPSALYRFSTFWNLLLDEYQFDLMETDAALVLRLKPQGDVAVQRFGHMLILKLAHGLISWLARHEVPIKGVAFAFPRPAFGEDYAVIFPTLVQFDSPETSIAFDPGALGIVEARSTADLDLFLENAPRDWIFTSSREHTQSLRVRKHLSQAGWDRANLTRTAKAMHMTPRTLIRRLEADGTSFQAIKDALRRDIAIRDLQAGRKSVEAIAHDVGFSSAANFHRAFQRWTGNTPSSYRRKQAPDM